MTPLLGKALAEAVKLPQTEQDALAALILAGLHADADWDAALRTSGTGLTALVEAAEDDIRGGRLSPLDLDRL